MSAQEFFEKPFDKPNEARQTDEKTGGLPPKPEVRGSFWSRCHDRWALVAFLTSFTVYLVLSVYCLYKVGTDYDDVTDIDVPGDWQESSSGTTSSSGGVDYGEAFTKETGYVFALASAVAFGLSFGLLFFVRYFPTVTIIIGPVISLLYMIGATVGCIYLKIWGEAAICAATAALIVLCLFMFMSRYRLARDLLDTANQAAKAHWSVFWTVLIGTLIQGLSSLWNIATFISVFLVFEPWHQGQYITQSGSDPHVFLCVDRHDAGCDDGDYCSAGMTWVLLTFVIIEYMWISGVISNVTLIVMAGGPYALVDGSLKVDEWWNWLILLYSFILALNIGLALTSALEAGVTTIFVCLDKDPDYLKQRNPRFYDDLCAHPDYYSIVMPEANRPLQPRERA
ncbi:hypothetical protein I350_05525 [Cryptococcus amylolentus CBS 6273]|uniref:Protein PNS1 n=1 Tax=Cryptococcus amylolentus CBS 6273 TaxID=1296118 RepID=A0A1E3JVP2_9TREE|nr:hypothetical protein I350_05525 [Cryptococcus amylolentus CBS 6273]